MQISDEMVNRADSVLSRVRGGIPDQTIRLALEAALSAAEPSEAVKTPFEIASKHIPEARVSLLSRAIRQGLNDYGWKNFGTLPEVLMGYIVQAEKSEAAAHPQKPRDSGHDGGDLSERQDNIGSAYTRHALTAQVQDVAEEPDVLWTCHNNMSNMFFGPGATENENEAVWDFAAQSWANANIKLTVFAAPAKQEG